MAHIPFILGVKALILGTLEVLTQRCRRVQGRGRERERKRESEAKTSNIEREKKRHAGRRSEGMPCLCCSLLGCFCSPLFCRYVRKYVCMYHVCMYVCMYLDLRSSQKKDLYTPNKGLWACFLGYFGGPRYVQATIISKTYYLICIYIYVYIHIMVALNYILNKGPYMPPKGPL